MAMKPNPPEWIPSDELIELEARVFPEGFTVRDEANAIVAMAFRNGPIEDLHAGKASELLSDPEHRAKLKAFLRGYCENGGTALQINVVDADLLRTAREMGVPPAHCLYVGDVDRVDGAAARAAGMSTPRDRSRTRSHWTSWFSAYAASRCWYRLPRVRPLASDSLSAVLSAARTRWSLRWERPRGMTS